MKHLVPVLIALVGLAVPIAASAQDGGALYKELCSSCHDTAVDRAPSREALRAMSPQRILESLEAGPMVTMTQLRTAAERRAIAEFASGRSFGTPFSIAPAQKAMCTTGRGTFTLTPAAPAWNGFGQNPTNARFQAAPGAGLTAAEVPRLKLKWAFGLPGDVQSWAGITLAGGRLFFGSIAGNVYSLDASTGCVQWAFDAGNIVRTAISVGPLGTTGRFGAFFGDARGNAYAVDAATGTLVWKVAAETYPSARLTGSPILHDGRLYVPVSSSEEGVGSLVDYECCKFRGSIVALDAATGRQVWKTYTIPEEPRPVRKNAKGVQLWGPSGAPIWSSPVVDPARRALYVTTGNNYSDPPTATSDAFLAMDLESGRVLWTHQVHARDAYVSACRLEDKTNCPEAKGPDFDFAASPILVSLGNGRRALVAGHKSGNVYAVDPDREGARLWETRVGIGGRRPERLRRALGSRPHHAQLHPVHRRRSHARRRHVRVAPQRRRARLAHAAGSVRRPAALQPGSVGRGQRHARRGLRRVARRPCPGLLHLDRRRRVGLRHRAQLRDRQRCGSPRWLARRAGPGDRRRHGVRELRLHGGRRRSGQRRAGLCTGLNFMWPKGL